MLYSQHVDLMQKGSIFGRAVNYPVAPGQPRQQRLNSSCHYGVVDTWKGLVRRLEAQNAVQEATSKILMYDLDPVECPKRELSKLSCTICNAECRIPFRFCSWMRNLSGTFTARLMQVDCQIKLDHKGQR